MANYNTINTVVFPVAGIGSRFLPTTKSVPKELLPILNRPLIEYAVEEALKSGIEKFIFVTSPNKQSITSHFKHNNKLEKIIRKKDEMLFSLISKYVLPKDKIIEVIQSQPRGLGHAIWCARKHIDGNAFAVMLPDDLIVSDEPCIKQLMNIYKEHNKSVVALQKVKRSEVSKYGVIDYKDKISNEVFKLNNMIEKPSKDIAPSNLAVIGRYILMPEVMNELGKNEVGYGGEIQLTDAIKNTVVSSGVIGCRFEGSRFDCGNVVGALEAQISMAMSNTEYKKSAQQLLNKYNRG